MNGRIREYTREKCPICGHRDWCGRREDGLVLCRRPPTPREVSGFSFKGMAKDGTTGMYVEVGREHVRPRAARPAGDARGAEVAHADGPPPEVSPASIELRSVDRVDPQWLTENYPRLVANLTAERRVELAAALGLPTSPLDSVLVGWWPERRWWNPETQQHEGEPGCWTFPEHDAHGRINGLGLRWPTGRKGQMAGGRRGLILPQGWRELADPVLVVEGPSDVVAGRAIGLNVIGRPSNSGGAELLTHLCRDRRVMVLGENDRKSDGRWPGREGAEAVAEKLSTVWERPVPVALPPDAAKDLRAWVTSRLSTTDTCDPADLGDEFLKAIAPPAFLLHAGPRARRGGKVAVRVFRWDAPIDAGPLFTDKFDLDSARARQKFAAAVHELEPAADVAALENQLLTFEVPELATAKRSATTAASQATPTEYPPSAISTGTRPQIQGNERQLRDIRHDALAALLAANDPPHLFRRAGGVARIALVQDNGDTAVPRIQQLDANALRGELTNAADWLTLHHSKQGDFLAPDLPPLAVAHDILGLRTVELPPLISVITCPAFTPDGGLITADGYDAASALWHHRTLDHLPDIADQPTEADIGDAREALHEIITDFPFVDDASRANTIALLLLPFVRPLIDGPTPLHAADAPTPGTGKGLLVQAVLWPALGYSLDIRSGARDADEWRKRITSELVAGKVVIGFDNATTRLDSEHLAAVLTATSWTDRVLGQTQVITTPNRATWICTGNNLAFSKELARRVIWIRLDAKVEAPEQRSGFRHSNLIGHVRKQRSALVAAALTLCRAWLAAGRPPGPQIMGSFESYTATLGGILAVAGIDGFLANADQLRRQADTETSEWRAFIGAWWDRWRDAWVGVSELSELLWQDEQRSDLLPAVVRSDKPRGAVTQLGMRLSAKRDCIIGGWRVTVGEKPDRAGRLAYRLAQTSGEPPDKVCARSAPRSAAPTHCDNSTCNPAQTFADLSGNTLTHTCANNARVCTQRASFSHPETPGMGKRSAKVCAPPQTTSGEELTAADLSAYLAQTLDSGRERSADLTNVQPRVRWLTNPTSDVPATVAQLAAPRDGWSPTAWHDRMKQLADRCEDLHPERAAELRMAAAAMIPPTHGGDEHVAGDN